MKKKMSFKTQTKYLQHRGVNLQPIIEDTNKIKFEQASLRERWALQQIMSQITKGKEHQIHYTPYWDYDKYDAILHLMNDGSILHTYIIEAKIRETHYPSLMLETKKLRAIKGSILSDNTSIMYVSFTPEGTFCYNMTKIEKETPEQLSITYIECPKQTMGDSTYINKAVYLLPTELSKKLDWKFNEKEYLSSLIVEKREQKLKGLFDDLF